MADKTLLIVLTRTYARCDGENDEFVKEWKQPAWKNGGFDREANPGCSLPLEGTTSRLLLVHGCQETVETEYDETQAEQLICDLVAEKLPGVRSNSDWNFVLCTHGPGPEKTVALADKLQENERLGISLKPSPITYTSSEDGFAILDLLRKIDSSWRPALQRHLSTPEHLVNRVHTLRDALLRLYLDLQVAATHSDTTLRENARKAVVDILKEMAWVIGSDEMSGFSFTVQDPMVFKLLVNAPSEKEAAERPSYRVWRELLGLLSSDAQEDIADAFEGVSANQAQLEEDFHALARSAEDLLVAVRQSGEADNGGRS